MRRGAAVLALVFATIYVGWPSPAFGRGHGGGGHAAASAHGSLAGQAHSMVTASLQAHFATRLGGSTIVTRPAPPLQHAFGGFVMHHHHHGPVFVFVEPLFFSPFLFGYAYPYSPLYDFGPPAAYAAPSTVTAPFFCWIDGIGFTDEERFARHLHEVHGVPLDEALSASELVDGRYVFFGY
jgi:hypothetical protein